MAVSGHRAGERAKARPALQGTGQKGGQGPTRRERAGERAVQGYGTEVQNSRGGGIVGSTGYGSGAGVEGIGDGQERGTRHGRPGV